MQKQIECNISGRVQLVMFRDFAQRKARALKLVGTVQNLSDGTVRVVAQGEESALQKYIVQLQKGPTFAKVLGVAVEWRTPVEQYSDFRIIFSGILDRI